MLVDIAVEPGHQPQIVAADLVNTGLKAASCYFDARIVRGEIDEADWQLFRNIEGVATITIAAEAEPLGRKPTIIRVPPRTRAAITDPRGALA